MAKVSFGGIIKEASLEMVPTADVGDYVLVHVGVAISIIDEEEAKSSLDFLKQMNELDELYNSPSEEDLTKEERVKIGDAIISKMNT